MPLTLPGDRTEPAPPQESVPERRNEAGLLGACGSRAVWYPMEGCCWGERGRLTPR